MEIQKDFRKIPVIELETPTVVLVGSPNVGKSSIVRAVSSGTPEVNDYPVTIPFISDLVSYMNELSAIICIERISLQQEE